MQYILNEKEYVELKDNGREEGYAFQMSILADSVRRCQELFREINESTFIIEFSPRIPKHGVEESPYAIKMKIIELLKLLETQHGKEIVL